MDEETVKLIRAMAALIGISALAAASRSILSEDRRSFGGFARGLVLAVFVGSIAGLLTSDMKLSPETQGAIVGVAAFVADDLLMMVLGLSKSLRDNPRELLDRVLNRFLGPKG